MATGQGSQSEYCSETKNRNQFSKLFQLNANCPILKFVLLSKGLEVHPACLGYHEDTTDLSHHINKIIVVGRKHYIEDEQQLKRGFVFPFICKDFDGQLLHLLAVEKHGHYFDRKEDNGHRDRKIYTRIMSST